MNPEIYILFFVLLSDFNSTLITYPVKVVWGRLAKSSSSSRTREVTLPISITHKYSMALTKVHTEPGLAHGVGDITSSSFVIYNEAATNTAWRFMCIGY